MPIFTSGPERAGERGKGEGGLRRYPSACARSIYRNFDFEWVGEVTALMNLLYVMLIIW